MREIKKYVTDDGKEFTNKGLAVEWQEELARAAAGLIAVKDWLNKSGRYSYEEMVAILAQRGGCWTHKARG